jgi:hypothetical protein
MRRGKQGLKVPSETRHSRLETWTLPIRGASASGPLAFLFSFFPDFYLFIFCCAGYIVAFTKVLTIYQIYHTWIHPLYHSPGVVSTDIIFLFAYMCTQYLQYIHSPLPFAYLLPSPTGTNPPTRETHLCSPIFFPLYSCRWHCILGSPAQTCSLQL